MTPKDLEENDMHIGASPIIFKRAKDLRNRMTPSEIILWEELKNKKLGGYKIRRQHPILKFILDFYCHNLKLVIEVDGEIHNTPKQKAIDLKRSICLMNEGLTILRFTNKEVNKNLEKVKNEILDMCRVLERKSG